MKAKRVTLYFLCLLFFMIQPFFELVFPAFKYFDEIIVVLFVIRSGLKKRGRIKTESGRILVLSGLLLIIGIIGNCISETNQPFQAILQDILSNLKLPLFVVTLDSIQLSKTEEAQLSDRIHYLIRLLFIFMAVTAILSQFVDIGMSSKIRYGLSSYHFIFRNPAVLNTYCYFYMLLFFITVYRNGQIRNNSSIFLILGIIAWILTLRSRAFSFAGFVGFFYWRMTMASTKKETKTFHWYYIILAAVGAIIISWDAIEKYYIENDRVARAQLLTNSFIIAKNYFPFGSGFATFGTEASRAYYSDIYYRYGMNLIYGLSPTYTSFVTDQYWFGILGQFGFTGLICAGTVIFYIYKRIWRLSNRDKGKRYSAYILFLTSLFASITAGTFIQASILPSVLVFYLFGNNNETLRRVHQRYKSYKE